MPALHSPHAAILLLRHMTARRRRLRNTYGRGRPRGGAASPPSEGAAVPPARGRRGRGRSRCSPWPGKLRLQPGPVRDARAEQGQRDPGTEP